MAVAGVGRGATYATTKLKSQTYVALVRGTIFEIGLPVHGEIMNTDLADVLNEINSSQSLIEEARSIVQHEHGNNKVGELDHMLRFLQATDILERTGIFKSIDELNDKIDELNDIKKLINNLQYTVKSGR